MVIVGPIAPYSNLPINADYYQPSRFVISAISFGQTTTITTTVDNNYVVGQQVRLLIPNANKAVQLNEAQGYVLSLPSSTQVEVSIDSNGTTAFVYQSTGTQAQILAIGDINPGQINSNGSQSTVTYVPGSFINISPN